MHAPMLWLSTEQVDGTTGAQAFVNAVAPHSSHRHSSSASDISGHRKHKRPREE